MIPHEGIYTFMDCSHREKKFFFEPYCQFGTDGGWVMDDEGNETKAFLAPCGWRMQRGQCPMGYVI